MKREAGIILMVSLLILMLLSLFFLAGMQGIFLYYKGLNQWLEKKAKTNTLEFIGRQLTLATWPRRCIIPEQPATAMTLLLKTKGCQLTHEKQAYLFLIEDSGIYPCLQTRQQDRWLSTKHVRINLSLKDDNTGFLQLRIAYPTKLSPCETPKRISLGLLNMYFFEQTVHSQ